MIDLRAAMGSLGIHGFGAIALASVFAPFYLTMIDPYFSVPMIDPVQPTAPVLQLFDVENPRYVAVSDIALVLPPSSRCPPTESLDVRARLIGRPVMPIAREVHVRACVLIDEVGRIVEVRRAADTDPALPSAFVAGLRRTHLSPARRNGLPVASWALAVAS
ncbi:MULTISPECIES: hypothetical protein [unclassified Sphingomonas]|jgi:hypothetical protein|uniref:hypothetical protein n=1 Tax=unclassified Sphingomonas TaxID=196159 RepID=UPI000E10A7E7|nr:MULTISPECIES: hypothetical protein [unclassified Sphingomonas]AXJ96593.1 hypothetical protein DM480_14935 [Sphingomonas sp. FARSPH]